MGRLATLQKPVIPGISMATRPLTLGIYYTNKSPVSTIIWLNIATKLCQTSGVAETSSTSLSAAAWRRFSIDRT
jgi:hypothetical protein